MIFTKPFPVLGLLLLLWFGAQTTAGAAPATEAMMENRLLLLDDSGADPVELQGDGLTSETLRKAIESMRGANQVLVLRASWGGDSGNPGVFLAAGADRELAVPIVSVLQWVDGNAARRLVLVLELRSSGAEASCELAVPDRALSSKVRLALICGAMPGTWDGTAPLVGVFDVAAARVTGPGRDGSAPAATAYGLLAELDGRIAAGLPLSARLRGRDWPLPVAVADQGFTDKLDPALVAVSGPAPATDMAAALAGLEQAGVGVRRGDKPAVSVRITATSAAAAMRLRTAVERAGGEISLAFENTLFALTPVAALRRLAVSADTWTIEPNRRTSHPFRSRNPE